MVTRSLVPLTLAAALLAPYENRAVFNAGAVMFHGVTDDPLARAAALLGDVEAYERLRVRALATYERIGAQWWRDRLAAWSSPRSPANVDDSPQRHFHPAPGGLWLVGRGDAPAQQACCAARRPHLQRMASPGEFVARRIHPKVKE